MHITAPHCANLEHNSKPYVMNHEQNLPLLDNIYSPWNPSYRCEFPILYHQDNIYEYITEEQTRGFDTLAYDLNFENI